MSDVHNKQGKLENSLRRLKQSDFPEEDIQLLIDFKNHLFAENVGVDRVTRYLNSFKTMQPHIDFRLSEAEKSDIVELVGKINRDVVGQKEENSPYTKAEWRKGLKKFYKWQRGEENPDLVDFFSSQPKKKNIKMTDPNDLPDKELVKKIRSRMRNPRDKFFILALWESGCRISELLNLEWGEVRDKGTHLVFKVDGKTGERRIPVKECREDFLTWKDFHPNPEPDSYIFTGLSADSQVSYGGMKGQMRAALERLDEEPDVKTNFHAFRKSRATFLAKRDMNIFQLMQFFGWSDPDTAKTYVRLANSDIEETFKEMHGIGQTNQNIRDSETEKPVQSRDNQSEVFP